MDDTQKQADAPIGSTVRIELDKTLALREEYLGVAVGHGNELVAKYCSEQLRYSCANTRFLHDNIVVLASRLIRMMPEPLACCYFVNSGSEGNDLAVRLARFHTKRHDIINLSGAYHGCTTSMVELSPYKYEGPGGEFERPRSGVRVVPVPDVYRGKYRAKRGGLFTCDEAEEAALCEAYVAEFKRVVDQMVAEGNPPAAFIAESMQGCGGQIIFPKNYLNRCQKIMHEINGLVIADEIQTGFGRIGSHMFAFQYYPDYVPDLVTVGKSFGNGLPIAAVVTTKQISQSFAQGPGYFNTFGGNPVSMAAGLAVLDELERRKLVEQASTVGAFLKDSFLGLMAKHENLGDVRGEGYYLGLDLVRSKESREPHPALAQALMHGFRENNILVVVDGMHRNVLKFKAPLCFDQKNAETFTQILDQLLSINA